MPIQSKQHRKIETTTKNNFFCQDCLWDAISVKFLVDPCIHLSLCKWSSSTHTHNSSYWWRNNILIWWRYKCSPVEVGSTECSRHLVFLTHSYMYIVLYPIVLWLLCICPFFALAWPDVLTQLYQVWKCYIMQPRMLYCVAKNVIYVSVCTWS